MKINNYLDGNTFFIEGMGQNYKTPNFLAETYYDHRIAMSFAIAGLKSSSYIEIASPESIDTSFPEFIDQRAREKRRNVHAKYMALDHSHRMPELEALVLHCDGSLPW